MTVLRRTIITAIVVITSVISVLIAYSINYKTQTSELKTKPKATVTTIKYTVKEYNGKIAVFENGNTEPLKVMESPYIRDLPKTDQEILSQGIIVYDKTELNKILEDYDN